MQIDVQTRLQGETELPLHHAASVLSFPVLCVLSNLGGASQPCIVKLDNEAILHLADVPAGPDLPQECH